MDRCTRSSCTKCSKKVEVFILLPLRRLGLRGAVIRHPRSIAAELVALELQVVIDEDVAELLAVKGARLESVERLAKARRQQRPVGGVRFVVARAGLQLALDPIETGDDLRSDVEIGIGAWLADAVLESRRRIVVATDHAHHRAAIVESPAGS